MKKILVVDESPLFRNFLKQKLEDYGFSVALAVNGLDGSVKLRQEIPDLLILDYYLSRHSSVELLQKKMQDPNTANVPVIMVSSKIDRDRVMQIAKFGVRKFFTKPIKVDALLKTVADHLQVTLDFDNTPCIIEAHFNDDILFVELAEGLNKEKVELLRFKLTELMDLYQVQQPKVLIIMSNIDVGVSDSLKLGAFLSNILDVTKARHRFVKILTNSDYVQKYVADRDEFKEIEVTNNLETAMDGLLGRKAGSYMTGGARAAQQEFLQASPPKKAEGESFNLKFEEERARNFDLAPLEGSARIAVVDDDIVIRELIKTAFSDTGIDIREYEDGEQFMNDLEEVDADLVFLDLLMPVMDGFTVLKKLNEIGNKVPVIILSALSKRESVVEALKYGVTSYIVKPLKPDWIRKKATEVLRMNF